MWCKMVTQQLQGDHRGFLLFRKSHNTTKRDTSIQNGSFFSKCVLKMAIPYDLTKVANMRRVEFGVSILVLFFFFKMYGVILKNAFWGSR